MCHLTCFLQNPWQQHGPTSECSSYCTTGSTDNIQTFLWSKLVRRLCHSPLVYCTSVVFIVHVQLQEALRNTKIVIRNIKQRFGKTFIWNINSLAFFLSFHSACKNYQRERLIYIFIKFFRSKSTRFVLKNHLTAISIYSRRK